MDQTTTMSPEDVRKRVPFLPDLTAAASGHRVVEPLHIMKGTHIMHSLLKRLLFATALNATLVLATEPPATTSDGAQQITRAGEQASITGSAAYFTGHVRVDPVWPANTHINASGGLVTFEPGARSAWHTHPGGQRLMVIAGMGLTQESGKPAQVIRPGDVVWCPPGVKHWHGAAPSAAMTHLAVTATVEGENVTWMENVSDEQYTAAAQQTRIEQENKPMSQRNPSPATAPAASETLSVRQQAILPIAAFAAAGSIAPLNAALNQGLDAGLSIRDAREILVQLYAYAGFPRSLNALSELMKVVDARKERGIQDAPGREPSGAIPKGDALRVAGTANQTQLVGRPVTGPVMDFAPAIAEYLQSHLFGAIFERDNLDWQSRELATVGMISALPGAEAQLQSHMAVSLNVGLTAAQLQQAVQVLDERVGADNGQRARGALERALAIHAQPQ